MPVVLLASYAAADRIPGNELLWLCPGSFASIAVQHATTAATLAVWTLICLSNAILYGLVGLMVCLPFLWRDRA